MSCSKGSNSSEGAFEEVADQATRWKSEKPGPNNSFDHCPTHSAETFHRADAHNRRGNHVSRGKRNAVVTRALNDQRGCCFSREAVHWLQFHHTMPQRANDSPAASGCSYRHRSRAKTHNPFRQHEDCLFDKI